MSVKLPTIQRNANWVDVDLQGGQSLRLHVTQPTFQQQIYSLLAESEVQLWERRIEASVTDWDGVVDDNGKPIPFSWNGLLALFATYPQSLAHVQTAVLDIWVTFPEDLQKNLPTPPANGGTGTSGETTALTSSSNSAVSSGVAMPPANTSAPTST